MRKMGVLLVVTFAIALTGCSGGEPAEPAASAAVATAASSEPAPITSSPAASTATGTDAPYGVGAEADAAFVDGIKPKWRGAIPADEELLAAAALTCEQLRAGTAPTDLVVVLGDGEDTQWNNERLTSWAASVYCPEFDF